MKLNFFAVAGITTLAVLFIAGCGESPTDTVKNWQNAIIAGDLEKANALSTDNTHNLNKLVIAFMKNERDNNGGPRIRDIRSTAFEKEEINENHAVVYYHTDKTSNQKIELIKVDGKWLVDAKK